MKQHSLVIYKYLFDQRIKCIGTENGFNADVVANAFLTKRIYVDAHVINSDFERWENSSTQRIMCMDDVLKSRRCHPLGALQSIFHSDGGQ